jgi:hypothetical protein
MLIARIASIASTPVEPGPVKKKQASPRPPSSESENRTGWSTEPFELDRLLSSHRVRPLSEGLAKLKLAELKSPARNFAELGRRSAPAFPSTAVRRRTKYG